MAAPVGNNYKLKWKNPEERKAACQRYCDFLIEGKDKEYYPEASPATINSYIENYPEDFDTIKIDEAVRINLLDCAEILRKGSKGLIPDFSAAAAIFRAKNKLNMKDKSEVEHSGVVSISQQIAAAYDKKTE
jgi:hypothetical protein